MLYLKYKIVTKKDSNTHQEISFHMIKTPKISSKILPKLLKDYFNKYPDESLVYTQLYEIEKKHRRENK